MSVVGIGPAQVMRVLSVIHYPFFGGPQNQALRLQTSLAALGVRVTVVLPEGTGNAFERLVAGDVDVVRMPLHRMRATLSPSLQAETVGSFAREIGALRTLIRRLDIDVVQLNGLVNPHAALAARGTGAAVVWQLLDSRPPIWLRAACMPVVLRYADIIMSTGAGIAAMHPGAESIGERLHPYFPPVDTSSFAPNPTVRLRMRAQLGLSADEYVVGAVANLTPQKGLEYFIRAASRVVRMDSAVRFLIVGHPMATQSEYAARLREEARRAGLLADGRLQFIEPSDDIPAYLAAFDLFVLSSVPRSEGIPTAMLEAMSAGVPVLATDVGAVSEAVTDGIEGHLLKPEDDAAMARAILHLHADPAASTRLGAAGRLRALRDFDTDVCARVHLAAYQQAIAHRAQAARGLGGGPSSPKGD